MQVKVLSYRADPYKDFRVGWCTVDISKDSSGKFTQELMVARSKTGDIFCLRPNLREKEEWVPTFGIPEDALKELCEAATKQVKPLMVSKDQEESYGIDPASEELPPF